MPVLPKELIPELTRKLVDEGKLIEAGFAGLQLHFNEHTTDTQLSELRIAFMAGAQHLFASIMQMFDPESEATEADMRRMTLIDDELRRFVKELRREH